MNIFTKIFYNKSFWFLFLLGLNLAMGQMPVDLPYSAYCSLVALGFFWTKYQPMGSEALVWGLGFSFGYFGPTFFWIIEPFLVAPEKTGWLAPFALVCLVAILSLILSTCFYLASRFGSGSSKNKKVVLLFLFFLLSELIRSELVFDFPWGLISSIWINTPLSQSLALFGPYWLSAFTIFSAFLLSRLWLGSVVGFSILLALYSFGQDRLNTDLVEKLNSVKVRIVQPNIRQSEKWRPELASKFLSKHIDLSKSAKENGVDIVVWPETAISYEIQNKNLRNRISIDLDTELVLGVRRLDIENNKLFNSAIMLAKNGNILNTYDKIKLVPFGEYIPFGQFLANMQIFGLAVDGLIGFSSGTSKYYFNTDKLGIFKILICYEAIFSQDMLRSTQRPSWIIHITNDAWFGAFNGPQQHLALTRMRAIEQGLPIVRSANTGISAMIGPYGRIHSKLDLGNAAYIDETLPSALEPTPYYLMGPKLCNLLLLTGLMLTIVSLIIIKWIKKFIKKMG